MTNTTEHKDYSEYQFEDFLQDDFFISSIKAPTPETIAYWERFQSENKNLDDFNAAKDSIQSIHIYHETLSPNEIEEMRDNIHRMRSGKKRRLRVVYLTISAVASVVLLMMVLRFTVNREKEPTGSGSDIVAFADIIKSEERAEDIQLVLSNHETIRMEKAESIITYDTERIVVDKKAITQNDNSGFNQLIVPPGKRSILNLSDGTKVWVNSDTRLVYPASFDDKERIIYVNGEIYLDVAKDQRRPFIVKTKDLDVQVMGTQFNVTAYDIDNEKQIVLVSGSVQVKPKNDKNATRLAPDQLFITGNGQNQIITVDTKKYTSWIDGIYYCEDISLDTILQRLSRYYGVEITCDPSISQVVFSGKLDLKENLIDIINGIAFTLPISFTENNGKYTITPI